MLCARVHLQERKVPARARAPVSASCGAGSGAGGAGKPWKFCQRRLVNPALDEDPRWINVYERFYCHTPEVVNETPNKGEHHHAQFQDLFLSVQNLKFQGNEQQKQRRRSGFKLKKADDGKIHRMFVKQNVVFDNFDQDDDDRSSQLTCYYYDDCAKYLQNYGRPFSSRSNYSLPEIKNKLRENKATQVEITNSNNKRKKKFTRDSKIRSSKQYIPKTDSDQVEAGTSSFLNDVEGDTKVCFNRTENKKSLTIARAQSPESVQVIRVDVVSAHAAAAAATALACSPLDDNTTSDQIIEKVDIKNSHYGKKYLVSNNMKNLEERVSGGSKVTLLCKTFKLTDRSKQSNKQKTFNCKLQLKK